MNVANVIAGYGSLYVAPSGTTPPSLTGSAADFAGFDAPGYTDDGVEFDYTPTDKDINVDEEASPVKVLITAEKLVVSVKLAETTLKNLYYAIAGATLASATQMTIGGLTIPNEFVMGFIGPSPSAAAVREILLWRVIQKQGVKMHYQRKDKLVYQCQFEALADSTQALGARLCKIEDF